MTDHTEIPEESEEYRLLLETPKAVGYRIRRKRLQKDLSLSEAADAIGISRSYLSMIETGQRKLNSSDTIDAIADTLGTTPTYIMRGIGDRVSEPRIDHRYYLMIQVESYLDECSTREIEFCLDIIKRIIKEMRRIQDLACPNEP